MERYLRPERLAATPNEPGAEAQYKHWKKTFDIFVQSLSEQNPNKLHMLINFVAPEIFEFISGCTTYESAVEILEGLFVKKRNKIFARYKLITRKQSSSESVQDYVQKLKLLAKECEFTATTLEETTSNYLLDALIAGIGSNNIRQRLLEKHDLTFDSAFQLAQSLEFAMLNSESFSSMSNAAVNVQQSDLQNSQAIVGVENLSGVNSKSRANKGENYPDGSNCWNCGNKSHPKSHCPARNIECYRCRMKGHFAHLCKRYKPSQKAAPIVTTYLSSVVECAAQTNSYSAKVLVEVQVGNIIVKALADTGATKSFIDLDLVNRLKVKVYPAAHNISLASDSYSPKVLGQCYVDVIFKENCHKSFNFIILENLVAPVLLGGDFMGLYKYFTFSFDGSLPGISLAALKPMKMEPIKLINIAPNAKPITTKSRRFNIRDQQFINQEVEKLLADGIIEESNSSWRAQVHVVRDENHKTRMVIDYSRTINRFTSLDGYPMKRIDELVHCMSKYTIFSSLDLQSAYHQLELDPRYREYTGFEARGKLYQFRRLPFGLRNAVAGFQRCIDKFIEDNNLQGVYSYVDNLYVGGKSQSEHDYNLKKLLEAASRHNFTFNEGKSLISTKTLDILGYRIENGNIFPDPNRVKPLLELPVPQDKKSLKRVVGMFAYYSKYIPKFSDRIIPLTKVSKFPLSPEEIKAFEVLKETLATATLAHIDENLPFVLETDASHFAISATLNQDGRPVAFYSRTFQGSEKGHSSVEKEAQAIIEGVRKWHYWLSGRNFTIITDQKPVSFIFDAEHSSKIKNDKLFRWRLELSQYQYSIQYRPGSQNVAADTFSRVSCGAVASNELLSLHENLCHPGVTRMLHLVRTRNLPYSVENIKKVIHSCKVCAELKPRYYNPEERTLIKATRPMERLTVDFVGPVPSSSKNVFSLTIVDEFSRFPWSFPCSDISAKTVIKCLDELFSVFGVPAYIHSDRGSQFMSKELKNYLHNRGVATSRTTAYNPQGNGQCERMNGTIWKTILLALKTRGLHVSQWESVLNDALHSIRSLLCTATNSTPHDRMFTHARRTSSGVSLPSWLASPGPVLLKRQVRCKNDPLCDEVHLLEANPLYAHIRYQDGRETTVSLRQLAPPGLGQNNELPLVFQDVSTDSNEVPTTLQDQENLAGKSGGEEVNLNVTDSGDDGSSIRDTFKNIVKNTNLESQDFELSTSPPIRRSTRNSKPPEKLNYSSFG